MAPLDPTSAPGNDQKVVAQHEAGCRRGPAGIAVQHRDDHGHVRAADREHEMHPDKAGNNDGQQQGQQTKIGQRIIDQGNVGSRQKAQQRHARRLRRQILIGQPEQDQQAGDVHYVASGQQ